MQILRLAEPWRRRMLAIAIGASLAGTIPVTRIAAQSCAAATIARIGGSAPFERTVAGSVAGGGRYVAFESQVIEFDGDSVTDIFVYDRITCSIELVSMSSGGVKGDGQSWQPSISDDGRFVVFMSEASNLVQPDQNGSAYDAFVRDRELGITNLISVDSSGAQPVTEGALEVTISGNGQFAAFSSRASTLVPGDTNDRLDVFVRNLAAGTTERVSLSSSGQQADGPQGIGNQELVISEDGRFVAFQSSMNTLVPNDLNNNNDIFVRDRLLGTTMRASLDSNNADVSLLPMHRPGLTGDGRFVFFSSPNNLVAGNTSCDGIFMRDLVLNTTSCPALDPLNASALQSANRPVVSRDGRYVAFLSDATHYAPGLTSSSTKAFVHDRVTGATYLASAKASGTAANGSPWFPLSLSADGQWLTFETTASNLVPGDVNNTYDVFVVDWRGISVPPNIDLVRDGGFANGLQRWQTFATPDASYIVTDMSGGELRFYRVPPPPGTSNQAVVFQPTWAQLLAHAPVEARFRLGNNSTVRKRMSVLVHDGDFSDLAVCTFWLAPNAPMRDYVMRTHTTKRWSNATISFYAATAGFDGGFYRVDTVSLSYQPILDDDVTDCIDPTAPAAPGGAPGPSLLVNGDFSAGLAPWATFGQITSQITSGVFEFVRPPGAPAGVLLQTTGAPLAQHDILTALFYLGNSSSVRKRVTLILHDQDFSDLSACTFWLAPNQPLSPYFMRTFATRAWTNATFSLYPATVGLDEWIRFTDATLQVTPGTTPLGTECVEPGADSIVFANRGLLAIADRARAPRPLKQPGTVGTFALEDAVLTTHAVLSGPRMIWQGTLDLRALSNPVLSFESSFEGTDSRGLAHLSLDGVSWITIANLPTSADWTTVDLDLSAYAGDVVHVRLVFDASATESGSALNRWRISRVRLDRRQ